MNFYRRKYTARPGRLQIVKPAVEGKTIATWPGKNGGWITYLTGTTAENVVATTDPNFNPDRQETIPLICFVDVRPESPEDQIEIRYISDTHVKGTVVYFE